MDDWETLHKSRFRAYKHHIEKEKEKYWEKSIRDTVEHFKHHISQQVENELACFSAALQVIAADIARAGFEDNTPDEEASVSMLVKGFTRPLQRKYCIVDPVNERSRVSDINPDVEIISIPDDSSPPSPMSLNQPHPWSIDETQLKEETPLQHGTLDDQDRSVSPLPDFRRANSKTVTPQRQVGVEQTSRGKRPLEPTEAGPSRQNKRARHGVSNTSSEYIDEEPTERGSIHCSEVEGLDFIFEHKSFHGYWFVVRCDRDSEGSGYIHHFKQHPMTQRRAIRHFQKSKAKKPKKCHGDDIEGTYSEEEIVRRFAYRVYGRDLTDEWVGRSNEKMDPRSSSTTGKGPNLSTRTRSQAMKGQRKVLTKNKGKGIAKTSTSTVAGPSNTTSNASSSRTAMPIPQIGPARRDRPVLTSSPGPSRPYTTTQGRNAPVADMGGMISLERRTSTHPTSLNRRNSRLTASGDGSSTGQGRLCSLNQSHEDASKVWDFDDDDPDDPASNQVVSDLIEANLT